MSTVKSFAVGNGDTFYIRHNSDNFSIIDCYLSEENKEAIVDKIVTANAGKDVTRFISTHPDEDHIHGLTYLDERIKILNFYCVKNKVTKEDETDDFVHYCALRDSDKAFFIKRGCTRRWMNETTDERGSAGINIIWPDVANDDYKEALKNAEEGGSPNNISAVIKYSLNEGATFLWMGDLETEFMEKIADVISWPKIDIVFAAHHGRDSGRIPHAILEQLQPKIIVLGEAPSRHLNYYGDYHILTQNTGGDLTFKCEGKKVHIFSSEPDYEVEFLVDEGVDGDDYYIGTLNV